MARCRQGHGVCWGGGDKDDAWHRDLPLHTHMHIIKQGELRHLLPAGKPAICKAPLPLPSPPLPLPRPPTCV